MALMLKRDPGKIDEILARRIEDRREMLKWVDSAIENGYVDREEVARSLLSVVEQLGISQFSTVAGDPIASGELGPDRNRSRSRAAADGEPDAPMDADEDWALLGVDPDGMMEDDWGESDGEPDVEVVPDISTRLDAEPDEFDLDEWLDEMERTDAGVESSAQSSSEEPMDLRSKPDETEQSVTNRSRVVEQGRDA